MELRKIAVPLILTLCLTLASCSFIKINRPEDDTDAPDVTAAESAGPDVAPYDDGREAARAEAAARVASLPDHDFQKDTFTVAVASGITFLPSAAADGYDDALIERCRIAGERYGIKFAQMEAPLELMLSDAYSAYLSGVYYADALMVPQSALGELTEKGIPLNTQSVPYADYSAEYYDRAAMDQATGGYVSPAIIGAASRDIGSFRCIYVNTALTGADVYAEMREAVRDGSWTWQKLLEIERGARAADGSPAAVCASGSDLLADAVYSSSGQNYFSCGFGKTPAVAFETETTLAAVDVMRSLFSDGAVFDGQRDGSTALEAFVSGGAVFCVETVGRMLEISAMGSDWGLVPMPKVTADQQDYCSFCSPDAPVFVIPAAGTDPEDAGLAIAALNAASYGYVDRCYSDRLVRTAVNNSLTLDMLDYVCGIKGGKGLYEFTEMYASRFPLFDEDTSGALWELVTGGGKLADKAAASAFDLNWRLRGAFPVS